MTSLDNDRLTLEEKLELIVSITKESSEAKALRNLLAKKATLVAYDGFEPAGRMDIGQVRYRLFSTPEKSMKWMSCSQFPANHSTASAGPSEGALCQ